MGGMDNDDFANVSWQSDRAGQAERPAASSGERSGGDSATAEQVHAQLGNNADAMDLAGVGDGTLECTVTQPLKENDGSKDAYVSYLVTTTVSSPLSSNTFS
jgi:sorting nexin-4